jgi:hypothetical protein
MTSVFVIKSVVMLSVVTTIVGAPTQKVFFFFQRSKATMVNFQTFFSSSPLTWCQNKLECLSLVIFLYSLTFAKSLPNSEDTARPALSLSSVLDKKLSTNHLAYFVPRQ